MARPSAHGSRGRAPGRDLPPKASRTVRVHTGCGPDGRSPAGGSMETEIMFVGGRVETFPRAAGVKLTPLGVAVLERDGDDAVRVLFPWGQIEKVTQRGAAVAAVYTW